MGEEEESGERGQRGLTRVNKGRGWGVVVNRSIGCGCQSIGSAARSIGPLSRSIGSATRSVGFVSRSIGLLELYIFLFFFNWEYYFSFAPLLHFVRIWE